MFQISGFCFVTGHSYGDYVSIARIMQKCVCIVNGTVYRIRIDMLKIGLVLGGFICNFTLGIKGNEFIFIALVLDQDGIIHHVFVPQKQLGIRTISANAAIFREVFV